jgi:hypothetical protein
MFGVLFIAWIASSTAILLILGYLLYSLGGTRQQLGYLNQHSTVAILAGIHALVKAEGLSKSTVIQRVIEKYNVLEAVQNQEGSTNENIQKFERDMHDIFLGDQSTRLETEQAIQRASKLNPRDLV